MDWDLQSHFEHVPDHQLQGPDYLTHIFGILDVLAGEKESTEMRRSVRAALYEGTRRSDESLAQYSLRREAQFSTASRYLSIPDELKGFMLEEQSGLSRQGLQSLRVLTGGDSSYDMVRKALKIMDIDEEAICKGKPHSYFQEFVERDLPDDRYVLEGDEVLDDEDILNAEEVSDVFFAIQQMDLDEDRAMTFLGDWQKRKRSWSENKQLKNAMKKDRRHFDDPSSRPARTADGLGRRKRNIAELKKITRCANCGERGHWKAECTQPYKPKVERPLNAFTYLGPTSGEPRQHFLANYGNSLDSYLTVPPGFAIIDPGAAQDLIGEKAFRALQERLAAAGLRAIVLRKAPPPASGIGGDAKPLFTALAPVFLGGKPGIIKLTVLAEDVPHLLSIGLLEHTKAVIDTDSNEIAFKGLSSKSQMTRLESGHRVVDVVQQARSFCPPPEVLHKYGLSEDAFNLPASADLAACLCDEGIDSPAILLEPTIKCIVWEGSQSPPPQIQECSGPWGLFFQCRQKEIMSIGSSMSHVINETRDAKFSESLLVYVNSDVHVSPEKFTSSCMSVFHDQLKQGIGEGSHISDKEFKAAHRFEGCKHEKCKRRERVARFVRSFPMLRGLITCITLLSSTHGAIATKERDSLHGWTHDQKRGPSRSTTSSLVPIGGQAAEDAPGHLLHQPQYPSLGPLGMSTSGRSAYEGGKPAWEVGEMPAMRESIELRPLRAGQPQTKFEKESPAASHMTTAATQQIRDRAQTARSTAGSSADTPMSRMELEQALSQHTQDLTSSLAQHLGPLIQSQLRLQEQLGMAMSYQPQPHQMPMAPGLGEMEDEAMENPNASWEHVSQWQQE